MRRLNSEVRARTSLSRLELSLTSREPPTPHRRQPRPGQGAARRAHPLATPKRPPMHPLRAQCPHPRDGHGGVPARQPATRARQRTPSRFWSALRPPATRKTRQRQRRRPPLETLRVAQSGGPRRPIPPRGSYRARPSRMRAPRRMSRKMERPPTPPVGLRACHALAVRVAPPARHLMPREG